MASPTNDDLDSLLQGLKDQYQQAQQQQTSQPAQQSSDEPDEITDLLSHAKSRFHNRVSQQNAKNSAAEIIEPNFQELINSSPTELEVDYLESWKSNFQSKQSQNKSQQDLIYQRNKQDVIRQEQQKQLNYKHKKRQAERWLANLDPHSDEGIWFNQLADSYDSRLEAAITYLETLEQ